MRLGLWLFAWVSGCSALSDSGEEPGVCVTIIEVDAAWVSRGDGEVVYDPCYDCDGENICDASACCPPGWAFLAPGEGRLTALCRLE